MKMLLITLIAGLTLGTALPTWAGPDWEIIERARKAKQAQPIARHGDAVDPRRAAAAKCPPDTPVMQLDHGPRAQTTPYLNQQRQQRYEAQVKACKAAAK